MKYNNKTKTLVCLIAVALIFLSSYADIQLNKPSSKFDTIEKTLNYINNMGNRLIATKDNKRLYSDLTHYLSGNFPKCETLTQEYTANYIEQYKFILSNGENDIIYDNSNSECTHINSTVATQTDVIVTDTLDELDEDKQYIYLAKKSDDIEKLLKYKNIALIIAKKNEFFDNQSVIIEGNDSPSILYVNNEVKLDIGEKVSLTTEAVYESAELYNVYTTLRHGYSNNAIVVTAHYDSTTSFGENYSRGVLDNGTGVAVAIDILRRMYDNIPNSNYDIVFAFVNSNENMIKTENSGSYQLNKLLSEKYGQILNVNLDCLGQKDVDTITYGVTGRVSDSLVQKYIFNYARSSSIRVERSAVTYKSDNMNFANSIYFYSMKDINSHETIHTENDTIDAVDIDMLNKCSKFIYNVLNDISKTSASKLFKYY